MADGFGFDMTAVTEPLLEEMKAREKAVDRGSMFVVREAGRVAKKAARKAAPVYGGPKASVHVRTVKKARKAGVNLSGGQLAKGERVEGNRIVVGLLRDSITSSRRLKKDGDGTYSIKVGPRGPRVHLYAAKVEVTQPYMRQAYRAVAEAMTAIAEKALTKASQGRR